MNPDDAMTTEEGLRRELESQGIMLEIARSILQEVDTVLAASLFPSPGWGNKRDLLIERVAAWVHSYAGFPSEKPDDGSDQEARWQPLSQS